MGFGEVSPGARACQVGVVDEVLDVLVEHESRNSAGPAHEMFDTPVQVARIQGFEVRVAEGRLVIVNHKHRGQHGRESCRERVCPYGMMQSFAVSYKNKNQRTHTKQTIYNRNI